MFLHLGYYVTESSGHNSEYNAWFRKRPDLIEKYCTHGTGWNPGVYAYILERLPRSREAPGATTSRTQLEKPVDLERGHEYAASIFNATIGDGDAVRVQRQRPQLRPDRQPAGGLLRRGAGAGVQARARPDARRPAAAAAARS